MRRWKQRKDNLLGLPIFY